MSEDLTTVAETHEPAAPHGIDPRGPRFGAGITAVIAAAAVVLWTSTAATVLLAVAAVLFAIGVARGAQGSLQGIGSRRWFRPRLNPPAGLEDPAPPRFAQVVGLTLSLAGLALSPLAPVAVPIAATLVLVASFLNSAFGFCLGCELYLLIRRVRSA